jgi:membrane protease YdiL (CAAX protease family)
MTGIKIQQSKWSAQVSGLLVALVLTTIFWWPPITIRFLPSDLVWRNVAAQVADWIFALALIAIVVFWERRPLSSLGFKPLTLINLSTGLGLGGFFMLAVVLWVYILSPILPDLRGMAMDSGGGDSRLPGHFFYWYAPLAWVTASFCEEVIYRGYAMERLLSLTKKPWVAVLVSHLAFVLYHVKDGWNSVAMLSLFGLLFPLYYIRFRDLTMMIVAHAFIDLMAIIGHATGIGPK